jgi:hypothetical protein
MAYSLFSNFTFATRKELSMVTNNDRKILRDLAKKVYEIATLPEMETRRKRWIDFNKLKPERPMVLCSPEGSWCELMQNTKLECSDDMLRGWEYNLRTQLYWWENINDDNTLEPFFNIIWDVHNSGYGVDIKYRQGENRGSYVWEPPIKNLDTDLDKLHIREWFVNRDNTYKQIEIATEIFGDILPARLRGNPTANFGMTRIAIDLLGLENFMVYMYDDPDNIHKLISLIRDDFVNMLEWHEREGLLSLCNENDGVGSGGLAYTDELPQKSCKVNDKVTLKDIWGAAESQETVSVSPEMFYDFILPYQIPVLEKTGLNCYGCCEPLDKRIDGLLKIPNMRRFSVSPWCNEEVMYEKLGKNYIFSRKPNPSNICSGFDENVIRKDLSDTLKIAGGGVLEFIMKDTHTVQNDPSRITKWVKIAFEEIDKYKS